MILAFLPNLVFLMLLIAAVYVFTRNILKIKRNINLGKNIARTDKSTQRWKKYGTDCFWAV